MTNRAVELDAGYDDAMAYANLLLRLKAATADDPTEVAAWNSQADVWMAKSHGRAQAAAQFSGAPGYQRSAALAAPPPPPKDFGNQPASASPIPTGSLARWPLQGSFWQVVGDGTATAEGSTRPVAGQGLSRGSWLAPRGRMGDRRSV